MKFLEARSLFPSHRPPGLPGDTSAPDWTALVARARALDSNQFPLTAMRGILSRENARLGADGAALERIRAIGPDSVFILAGQQAGLFGGPLYTLYKAMHAVRLAERLAEETGRDVVPVFWVASDDHDFEEVREVEIRTGDGSPFRAEYTPAELIPGAPVGEIVLDEGIGAVLDALAHKLPPGDRGEAYLALLRRCWTSGTRWTDAFAAELSALLSPRGLVFFEPRWAGVKLLLREIMRAELEDPLASSALVNEEADRFETSRERRKALRKPESSTNLFLETAGVRRPVLVDGNGFRAGDDRYSRNELLDLLDAEPERFSPGAALRPVCQDSLMPVAATIAGPGERRYLSQLRAVYNHFGVNGSLVWPRASFTLVDHRALRTVEKEGIALARLFEEPERLMADLAVESLPMAVCESLDALDREITNRFDAVALALGAFDATLPGAAEKERSRALHAAASLRERISRIAKARLDRTAARLGTVHRFLLPEGDPQERRFGLDSMFTVFGPEGIASLTDAVSPGEELHRLAMPE